MSNLRKITRAALITTMFSLFAAPVSADDSEKWSGSISLYGWLLSLHGDAVIKGDDAAVDIGFGQILNNMDFGMMGEARVRYEEKYGLFLDGVYGKVSDDGSLQKGPLGIQAGLTVNLMYLTFGASYRFDPIDLGPSFIDETTMKVAFEPYVGGRFYDIRFTTSVTATLDQQLAPRSSPRGRRQLTRPPLGYSTGRRVQADVEFIDPIIGIRTQWMLGDRWDFVLAGDVGGFGVGSDFSWDAAVSLGYRFGLRKERDGRFFVGYRANGVDYKKGSGATRSEWDMVTRGAIVGLTVDF